MDFQSLSRRQLQALCKKNKIPANLTNVAMANSLSALQFVEGIEEIMNPSESDIAAQSPMVPPTGGRSRASRVVGVVETPGAVGATAMRRRAAASTSVRRQINESLDEIEEVKNNVSVKTPAAAPASRRRAVRETSTVNPVYSTRRSTRLAEKIQEPKERSEAIKINSFTEEIDENVEVKMEGGSVDQSETSEMTVVDNLNECSVESEVKSIDESEAISEETSDNQNGDVAVATIEQTIASDIKTETDQEEDEPVKVSVEVHEIETEDSNVAQETKPCIEDTEKVKASFVEVTDAISSVNEEALLEKDTEMNSIVDEEPKAAFEDSEMKPNVYEEPKASTEGTEINSIVDEEPKAAFADSEMKPNVDEEPKASAEGTEMKANVDEEIDIAESEGHVIANVTVDMQESDKEEQSEIESSDDVEDMSNDDCQEEMFIPEVESEDELVDDKDNLESNFSAIGGEVHIEALEKCLSKTPMKNSAGKTPKAVGRLIQASDDKENVNTSKKSVVVKDSKKWEDLSMRQLIKKIKEMEISTKPKKEGEEDMMKATTTRPALKTLSENMMVVESKN